MKVPREWVDRALIAWHQPLPSEIPADLEERAAMEAALTAAVTGGPMLEGHDIEDGYVATEVLVEHDGRRVAGFVIGVPNGLTFALTCRQVLGLARLSLREDVQARWDEMKAAQP